MAARKSKIYIKPSKRGSLRKAMGAKKGQKLSVSAMKRKMKNASPAMRKKLNFAINARKWKHELGGELPMYWDGSTLPFDLGTSFAEMNNLPQAELLSSGLAGTNNPGGNNVSGNGGGGTPSNLLGIGIKALTSITGSLGKNMAIKRNEFYEDASERMRQVDVGKATKGAGFQAFLEDPFSFGIGGKKRAELEAEEFNENIAKQKFAKDVRTRFSTMPESPTYPTVAKQGGYIKYGGDSHNEPSGGILVDEFGNKSAVSQNQPVALTEDKEVARYEPETGSTYIYSDALGFARPTTRLVNKYKLDENTWNNLYKNDKWLREAVDKQFDNMKTAQEFTKETKTSARDSLGIFKKGGQLSSAKAKEILRDGTAHGKKLTAKQKRYFGWVAGGMKADGGELNKRTVLMPKANLEYDRDLSMNRDWMGSLTKAKDLDELYSTPVGNWKGNPMSLKEFTEMPDYVTGYYNPNYAIEFNKNRLGLPNTFQDINLGVTRRDPTTPTYSPAANIRPANDVAYYRTGGDLPKYQNGGEEESSSLYPGIQRWARGHGLLRDILKGEFNPFKKNPDRPWQTYAGTVNYIPIRNNTIPQKETITAGPLEGPRLTTKKTSTGTGKPRIVKNENLMSSKVGYPNFNIPDLYTNPNDIIKTPLYQPDGGDVQIALNKLKGEESVSPWLNPAGHLLSGVWALADYRALKGAKPEDVSLGRVGAEKISLARQRVINERNAAAARAINRTSARGLGLSGGAAAANTASANTGVNRLLGEQNIQSLLAEEQTNAQMQQQANMVNAELAAQEGLFNTQRMDAYKMLRARANPAGNLARTAAGYFADNAAYQQGYDTLQMLAPNAELYNEPGAGWLKRTLGKPGVRLRDKTL